MSSLAIRAEHVGKQYRIGVGRAPYRTLREAIRDAARAPLQLFGGARQGPRASRELVWALRDVSFDVRAGEVLGIIGRNGAGKSTLLKVLSRITEPTTGRVEVHGRVGSLLEVGTGFHPELTGRDNIYLNGSILGMDRAYIDRRFEEIVEFSGVARFIDTPVKRYSSGMYLRLAFAVAAHLEPEILIVDEVLAVGDAEFQKRCLGRMGDLAQGGRTVLFVSHQTAVVRELCQNVLWMEGGRVRAIGAAAPITDSYLASSVTRVESIDVGRCALRSAEILDAQNMPSIAIRSRHSWGARIEYEIREPMPIGVSIRVSNAQGVVVFDAHESVGGARSRAPGRYSATWDLSEVSLAPGPYWLSVYLMVHQGPHYLSADPYVAFTVEGVLAGHDGTVRPFDLGGVLLVEPRVITRRLGVAAPRDSLLLRASDVHD